MRYANQIPFIFLYVVVSLVSGHRSENSKHGKGTTIPGNFAGAKTLNSPEDETESHTKMLANASQDYRNSDLFRFIAQQVGYLNNSTLNNPEDPKVPPSPNSTTINHDGYKPLPDMQEVESRSKDTWKYPPEGVTTNQRPIQPISIIVPKSFVKKPEISSTSTNQRPIKPISVLESRSFVTKPEISSTAARQRPIQPISVIESRSFVTKPEISSTASNQRTIQPISVMKSRPFVTKPEISSASTNQRTIQLISGIQSRSFATKPQISSATTNQGIIQPISVIESRSFVTKPEISSLRTNYVLPRIGGSELKNKIRRQHFSSGEDPDGSTETTHDFGRFLDGNYRAQIETEAEALIKRKNSKHNVNSEGNPQAQSIQTARPNNPERNPHIQIARPEGNPYVDEGGRFQRPKNHVFFYKGSEDMFKDLFGFDFKPPMDFFQGSLPDEPVQFQEGIPEHVLNHPVHPDDEKNQGVVQFQEDVEPPGGNRFNSDSVACEHEPNALDGAPGSYEEQRPSSEEGPGEPSPDHHEKINGPYYHHSAEEPSPYYPQHTKEPRPDYHQELEHNPDHHDKINEPRPDYQHSAGDPTPYDHQQINEPRPDYHHQVVEHTPDQHKINEPRPDYQHSAEEATPYNHQQTNEPRPDYQHSAEKPTSYDHQQNNEPRPDYQHSAVEPTPYDHQQTKEPRPDYQHSAEELTPYSPQQTNEPRPDYQHSAEKPTSYNHQQTNEPRPDYQQSAEEPTPYNHKQINEPRPDYHQGLDEPSSYDSNEPHKEPRPVSDYDYSTESKEGHEPNYSTKEYEDERPPCEEKEPLKEVVTSPQVHHQFEVNHQYRESHFQQDLGSYHQEHKNPQQEGRTFVPNPHSFPKGVPQSVDQNSLLQNVQFEHGFRPLLRTTLKPDCERTLESPISPLFNTIPSSSSGEQRTPVILPIIRLRHPILKLPNRGVREALTTLASSEQRNTEAPSRRTRKDVKTSKKQSKSKRQRSRRRRHPKKVKKNKRSKRDHMKAEAATYHWGMENHKGMDDFFMYANIPRAEDYEYGYRVGGPEHNVERHHKTEGAKSTIKLNWEDQNGDSGDQYWEFNHDSDQEPRQQVSSAGAASTHRQTLMGWSQCWSRRCYLPFGVNGF